jgi:hypothetical protein
MEHNDDNALPTLVADPAAPDAARPRRHLSVATMVNAGALLSTTAWLLVGTPKFPPFVGD